MTDIREAVRQLAGKDTEHVILRNGIVKSVDWDKRTCIVYLDKDDAPDLLLYDVRLRSVADEKKDGVCIRPVDGSMVLVGTINNNENNCYVAACSEVKTVEVQMKEITLTAEDDGTVKLKCKNFEWEADEIKINNGSLGGLIKIDALVSDLNDLKTAFNTHTHSGVMAGPGSTGVPSGTMVTTVKNNLEDTKVTH